MNISTLTGNNSYLLDKYVSNIRSEFTEKYGDFSVEVINCDEVDTQRINEAVQNLPFLSDGRLVVLKNPSANKGFVENVEHILEGMPEITTLIIIETKLDKRSNYYKYLQKHTDYKEFNDLDVPQLATWLVGEAKNSDAVISLADARYLVERVGINQQLLAQELKKLITYDKTIKRVNIDDLTVRSPHSTIFDLLESAFAGNTQKALELYKEQRQMKVEPQQIIAMFAWQLQILALVKTSGNKSPQDIAKEAKLNPYVVSRSAALAKKITYQALEQYVEDLYAIDIASKTINIDIEEALQNYILKLGC
mgnify:FL=1